VEAFLLPKRNFNLRSFLKTGENPSVGNIMPMSLYSFKSKVKPQYNDFHVCNSDSNNLFYEGEVWWSRRKELLAVAATKVINIIGKEERTKTCWL
jgi:hypothetical protein